MQSRLSVLFFVAALFVNSFALSSRALAGIDSTYAFQIKAQNLSSALLEFSKQADVQVLSASEDVKDKNSSGVSGEHTAREALGMVLQGTELRFRVINDDTVTIESHENEKGQQINSVAGTAP